MSTQKNMTITTEDFINMAIQDGVVRGAGTFTQVLESQLQTTVLLENTESDAAGILQEMIDAKLVSKSEEVIKENIQELKLKRNALGI
jgi:hypothetical protein